MITLDSQELGGLSEEILRRQQIIEEQLAELKEITARLTSEEQRDLVEAIKQKDADAERQGEQVCFHFYRQSNGWCHYPLLRPLTAIWAMMSVNAQTTTQKRIHTVDSAKAYSQYQTQDVCAGASLL